MISPAPHHAHPLHHHRSTHTRSTSVAHPLSSCFVRAHAHRSLTHTRSTPALILLCIMSHKTPREGISRPPLQPVPSNGSNVHQPLTHTIKPPVRKTPVSDGSVSLEPTIRASPSPTKSTTSEAFEKIFEQKEVHNDVPLVDAPRTESDYWKKRFNRFPRP